MIISGILIAVLVISGLYGFFNANSSKSLRLSTVALSGVGIVFVLAPELTTELARMLGVGRGADLLLYCWVVLSLAMLLQFQIGLSRVRDQMTEISRCVAIVSAERPVVASADVIDSKCGS